MKKNCVISKVGKFAALFILLLVFFNSCKKNDEAVQEQSESKIDKTAMWPGWPDYDRWGNPINHDGADTGSEWDGIALREVVIYGSYTKWEPSHPWKSNIPVQDFEATSEGPGSPGGPGGSGNGDDPTGKIYVEYNGTKDPDWPTDCHSFAYEPTSDGDYQVCGVTDLRFDFIAEFINTKGQYQIDYFKAAFEGIVYFEYPRTRVDGTFISSKEAAIATARIKDDAEEILESHVENSPTPTNGVELQLLLNKYMTILKSLMKAKGGRVTLKNNYHTSQINVYRKSIGSDCR